jgi:hypothetical protein
MALDAETGIYTFDDGPEIRELERMYGNLRVELTGKIPDEGLPAEEQGRPAASAVAGAIEVS